MMPGVVHDQNMEKQMGCMAGFLQLFDRNQLNTKRLPSTPEPQMSVQSSEISTELKKPLSPSPAPDMPPKSPLPLPIYEFKEGTRSSWKFCKETPRLSLDSRASFDAKGSLYPRNIKTNASILSANSGDDADENQRRSPSVIARLMGLEQLPHSNSEPVKKSELRRSASESRVSRDYTFFDGNNFHHKQMNNSQCDSTNRSRNLIRDSTTARTLNQNHQSSRKASPLKSSQQRKSFFDSADIFPEPKQTVSIYGEIEKRLKMRGIDEQSKDLETLKQILEALQLKGLLHSKKPSNQKNFIRNRSFSSNESPIVVMKPWRSSGSPPSSFKCKSEYRKNLNVSPGTRCSNSNSPVRRKPLSIETQRRVKESTDQGRVSPIHSPKLNSKRIGSPRNKKSTVEIHSKERISTSVVTEDESSSISGSTVSTSSQTDTERTKMEEYKEGRSLLERCDKLLNSIAEMTATELQPSPVSVLDSSFYKDESSSPSPIIKRTIHFPEKSAESVEDIWNSVSPTRLKCEEDKNDSDFVYISEILKASNHLPEDTDIFLLLEKQQYHKGNDTSKVSILQRKLKFDTIIGIIERNKQLPPWKALSKTNENSSLQQIWSEFQRIRERESADDLFDIVCGVLKKDLAGDTINGWGECHVETAEAVLYIERLIFKDLIVETIGDLTEVAGKTTVSPPRRKLIF